MVANLMWLVSEFMDRLSVMLRGAIYKLLSYLMFLLRGIYTPLRSYSAVVKVFLLQVIDLKPVLVMMVFSQGVFVFFFFPNHPKGPFLFLFQMK